MKMNYIEYEFYQIKKVNKSDMQSNYIQCIKKVTSEAAAVIKNMNMLKCTNLYIDTIYNHIYMAVIAGIISITDYNLLTDIIDKYSTNK